MTIYTGDNIAEPLSKALGIDLDRHVQSIDIHCAIGEIVTVTVKFAAFDSDELVEFFEQFELVKREPKA